MRGAAGYLLVADGTRQDTLYKALALQTRVEEIIGSLPFLLLMNKADLADQWSISERETTALKEKMVETSAKTGLGVEEAFHSLAKKLAEA